MPDRDFMADVLDSLQDVSRQLGALTERVTRIEQDTTQLVATLHRGNGREAVVTRLAQVETKAKETRGRVITLEEEAKGRGALVESTGVTNALVETNRGLMDIGKSVFEKGIVPILAAVAAYFAATWGR